MTKLNDLVLIDTVKVFWRGCIDFNYTKIFYALVPGRTSSWERGIILLWEKWKFHGYSYMFDLQNKLLLDWHWVKFVLIWN